MKHIVNSSSHNFSTTNQNCEPFVEDTSSIKAIKILVYSFVLIVSLFGNTVIIATIVRNNHMRTTINFLVANMAVSDILISTFAVPIKLCEIAVGPRRWSLDGIVGLISCKVSYFLQDISTAVSIQSLVVIAINRYRGIVFPFRPAIITPKRCKIIIPLVWLSSMGLHAIYFYTIRIVTDNGTTYCKFNWAPAFDPRKAQEQYIIIVFVFIVILPFSIITVLYSLILWSLRKKKGINCFSSEFSRQRHNENTKIFRYIFAIMFSFTICILPVFIYGILFYFVWKWKMPCNMEQFGFAVHFVLFSNAALSPVLTFVFNGRYRKGLKDVLKALNLCHRDAGVNLNQEELELNELQPGH